jgi:multiple sugar transport system permease protein
MGGISHRKQTFYFILFISFSLVFGILDYYVPMGFSAVLTFTNYSALSPSSYKFVGISNFITLIHDSTFWISLKNTIIYTITVVPVTLILSLFIAIGLNRKTKLNTVLRLFYIMPLVTSSIAISYMWMWIFAPNYGLADTILSDLNLPAPNWLTDPHFAIFALAIVGVWSGIGYYTVLFLAGLQNIPMEYYEAARIDGATKKDLLLHITLPLLTPMTFFVFIMLTIGTFQLFDTIFMMTSGGPGIATYSLVFYVYELGFYWYKMGYGITVSWVLYAILLIFTVIQFKLQGKWVHYEE